MGESAVIDCAGLVTEALGAFGMLGTADLRGGRSRSERRAGKSGPNVGALGGHDQLAGGNGGDGRGGRGSLGGGRSRGRRSRRSNRASLVLFIMN